MTVENHDGEKLGRVKNLAVDMQSGQAKYALISAGGFVGVGSHLKVVPAQAVSTATAKKEIASLDVSKRRWAKAPLLRKADLAALSDPAWSKKVALFYSPPPAINMARTTESGGPQGGHTSTSREPGVTQLMIPASGPMQLAGDLVGRGVIDRQQQPIGEVSDLLVDLAGQKPAFAIISASRLLKKKESFAVPLSSLSLAARDKLVLDANRKMFEEAKPFDESVWQAASISNSSAIYRFEGK